MTAHQPADVEDRLDASIGWRRIEMHSLKSALEEAALAGDEKPLARALARSVVTMAYAHWEGFVKEACQEYVRYVARRRPKSATLHDGLLISCLTHLSRRISSGDVAARDILVEMVRRPNESRARIPQDSLVDTKSNLRFGVYCSIMEGIGLSHERLSTREYLIDRSLCDMRNSIAHGRDAFPRARDAVALHADVLDMMETTRDVIMAAVRTSAFARAV